MDTSNYFSSKSGSPESMCKGHHDKSIEHLGTGALINLAQDPDTVCTLLAKLAAHTSSAVRAAVAENANTPVEILCRLVEDHDPDLRYSLAENHNLCPDLLKILAEDENPYVAARAQRTLQRAYGHCVSAFMPTLYSSSCQAARSMC